RFETVPIHFERFFPDVKICPQCVNVSSVHCSVLKCLKKNVVSSYTFHSRAEDDVLMSERPALLDEMKEILHPRMGGAGHGGPICDNGRAGNAGDEMKEAKKFVLCAHTKLYQGL
ncbi:hypothetical protein SK128_005453, partial [Halocaridina rubra]